MLVLGVDSELVLLKLVLSLLPEHLLESEIVRLLGDRRPERVVAVTGCIFNGLARLELLELLLSVIEELLEGESQGLRFELRSIHHSDPAICQVIDALALFVLLIQILDVGVLLMVRRGAAASGSWVGFKLGQLTVKLGKSLTV